VIDSPPGDKSYIAVYTAPDVSIFELFSVGKSSNYNIFYFLFKAVYILPDESMFGLFSVG
jgi:hypothetical protein